MSASVMGGVISRGPQEMTAFCVLMALADPADDFGFACPSLQSIAVHARCDVRTVMRKIADLEAGGWLCVARKLLNGKSNLYLLNLDKIGVTLSPRGRRSPVFIGLLKNKGVTLSPMFQWLLKPESVARPPIFRDPQAGPAELWKSGGEAVPAFFCAEKSGDTNGFSGDNPQPPQVTNPESQVTKQGGSSDIAMSLKPLEPLLTEPLGTVRLLEPSPLPPRGGDENEAGSPSVENSVAEACDMSAPMPPGVGDAGPGLEWVQVGDPVVERRATAELGERFGRMRGTLRADMSNAASVPLAVRGNFTEIVPGSSDFDTCFRDWWLLELRCVRTQWQGPRRVAIERTWVFVTGAADLEATGRGIAKYGNSRLRPRLRKYFAIGPDDAIEFVVEPAAAPAAQAESQAAV